MSVPLLVFFGAPALLLLFATRTAMLRPAPARGGDPVAGRSRRG
ncbi:hypothetical protein [Roseomonas nitratireducens]|nr:hypothetical protein [Neoroseomonas nitratireducens]